MKFAILFGLIGSGLCVYPYHNVAPTYLPARLPAGYNPTYLPAKLPVVYPSTYLNQAQYVNQYPLVNQVPYAPNVFNSALIGSNAFLPQTGLVAPLNPLNPVAPLNPLNPAAPLNPLAAAPTTTFAGTGAG